MYKYAIKHLNKAERFIRAGEYDYDGKFYDAAIGHAYYAMYHAARALLLLLERSPKTHSGVINSLWENKNKLKLDDEDVKNLSRVFSRRIECDYGVDLEPKSKDLTKETIELSKSFVEKSKKIVEGWGTGEENHSD